MKAFLEELFEYNHHFNEQLVAMPSVASLPKANKWFCHIINAHYNWNSRILLREQVMGVWQLHTTEALESLVAQNHADTMDILANYDLNEIRGYTNSRGESYKNTIQDILFHVVNHTTHHRAQIASQIRQEGMTPPVTDYITFKRKQSIQ
jgi:uncharacterized damage-inducible protein DinB